MIIAPLSHGRNMGYVVIALLKREGSPAVHKVRPVQ